MTDNSKKFIAQIVYCANSVFLACILLQANFPLIAWDNKTFSEDSRVLIRNTNTSVETGSSAVQNSDLETASVEGRTAFNEARSLLNTLRGRLQRKEFSQIGSSLKYVEEALGLQGKYPSLIAKMAKEGVDPNILKDFRNDLAEMKKDINREMTQALVTAAEGFEGYSTRRGPSRGNLACAWLVSHVLRAAGLVPAGWMETSTPDLAERLITEFGWKRVSASEMRPGDIVHWSPRPHTGVVLENGNALSNSSRLRRGTIHPVSGYYDGWIPRFAVRPPGA
ncbi:MAG: hypothetical protein HQM10_18065 [Candidatus Riflebacteria bacterium]|nr:hypothetical protein [Candidatus Riflebacteria bacterium]